MMAAARTYNQAHVARPLTSGRRRVSIYWTWSYPWEVQRNPAEMENRFSTMTEVRTVLWPIYEKPEYQQGHFLQGIAGTLELFHVSTLNFQRIAEEETGFPVAIFQRIDQAGFRQPIDERVLADCDTLMVFGLDHLPSDLHPDEGEAEAIREWLKRPGTCLVLAPHHDVGFTNDYRQRQQEYLHHGDPLVPRQQRFTTYTRGLMTQLDVPVRNVWGLCPASAEGKISPLTRFADADALGLLDGVDTLSFHRHLPHYELTDSAGDRVVVLAAQPAELGRPHPFTAAGNTEFNVLLWMPPDGERAGHILMVDSTHFTTLFGATQSVEAFWRNLVRLPV